MKTIQYLFLTVFSFSLVFPVFSQNQDWIVYTSGNEVYSLAEEGNYIWVGTSGGLTRLDKSSDSRTFYNTTNSELPSNNVHCIAIDDNGNKWIGTGGSGRNC